MRRYAVPIVTLLLALASVMSVSADRRYFVQSYTPYLAAAGNLELEAHSIAGLGQGDSTNASWQNRLEFEYGITDRLTGAFYLNFIQAPGLDSPTVFDGPSLELIYQLAAPGRWPVDPAAYVEVRANGSEVEFEPKLLLARRLYKLVGVVNVVGEIERMDAGPASGETEKAFGITAGASRELGPVVAVGLESAYLRELVEDGPDASRLLFGPTLNFQTPKVQLALGWHPQLRGRPRSNGNRNLADFPRSEFRLILGVGL